MRNYQPHLPKMEKSERIIILDMSQDTAYSPLNDRTGEALDVMLITVVIQGIVNRSSPKKIYFTHLGAGGVGKGDWSHQNFHEANYYLEDGMLPVKKEKPSLDKNQKYPVLKYLLDNYNTYIKGKIKIPVPGKIGNDSPIMAGITACGQGDFIPVTDAAQKVITELGYDFTCMADIRDMSEKEAFIWARDNYFTDKTNRKVFGYHCFRKDREVAPPVYFDYLIANRAFVHGLDLTEDENKNLLTTVLNSDNYNYGTPVMTYHEAFDIDYHFDQGFPLEISLVPNYTVHSSFPSKPENYTQSPEGKAHSVNKNTLYLGFYVTDGDSARYGQLFHYDFIRNSQNVCNHNRDLPLGFSISGICLDIFPNLLKWYSENTNNDKWEYIYTTLHGDGVPGSDKPDSVNAFKEITKNYIQNANGLFRGLNFFNTGNVEHEVAAAAGVDYWIRKYQGEKEEKVNWMYKNNIPSVNLAGPSQASSSESAIKAIRYAVAQVSEREPAFVLATCSDGGDYIYYNCSHCPFKIVEETAANLEKNPPDGRKIVYLTPRDLAATWKKYFKK